MFDSSLLAFIAKLPSESITLDHWRYDDNTKAGVLTASTFQFLDNDDRILSAQLFPSNEERKNFFRAVKKRDRKKGFDIDHKKIDLPCGLTAFSRDRSTIHLSRREEFKEFEKLLYSCGQDDRARAEILNLVSSIFAGYIARLVVEQNLSDQPSEFLRAPILLAKYSDGAFANLLKIFSSTAVETTASVAPSERFIPHTPIFLPKSLNGRNIVAEANVLMQVNENDTIALPLPAQYRDTAVLVQAKAFPVGQLREFQRRNRWATIFLYNFSPANSQIDPLFISSKSIAGCDGNWRTESVKALVEDFVDWLAGSNEVTGKKSSHALDLERYWLSAVKLLKTYHQQKGVRKIRSFEAFYTCLRLTAMHIFYDFCVHFGTIDCAPTLLDEWRFLLLPGCCERPISARPLAERSIITERDSIAIFEETLNQMLTEENLPHILSVPPKWPYDRTDPDNPAFAFWGYLSLHRGYGSKPAFYALRFDEERFFSFAQPFCPVKTDLRNVVSYVRKHPPAYWHKTRQTYLPRDLTDKTRYYCITLKLNDLTFLDESIRQELALRALQLDLQSDILTGK